MYLSLCLFRDFHLLPILSFMLPYQLLFCLLLGAFVNAIAQNTPSLLSGKNINATFSIIAYEEATQEWGIAVATNNIYVGNSTIYIEPGIGAFSVIAETAKYRYLFFGFGSSFGFFFLFGSSFGFLWLRA